MRVVARLGQIASVEPEIVLLGGFPHIALRWLAEGGLRKMVEHCNADHWPHDLLTEQLALLLINAFFPRIRDATIEMGLDEQFRDVLPRAEIEFSCAP